MNNVEDSFSITVVSRENNASEKFVVWRISMRRKWRHSIMVTSPSMAGHGWQAKRPIFYSLQVSPFFSPLT